MPKSLISKLTTGPKLNDLQKHIALKSVTGKDTEFVHNL